LLSVLVGSDDKASALLIVDGVPHTTHFHRNLVSPAILNLHKDSSNDDESRSFIDHTVGFVHDK